jgi:osmotically-inducible protein OsmY
MKKAALGLTSVLLACCYSLPSSQSEDANPSADNTRRNASDQYNNQPTAQNQSNDRSAIALTSKLRRKIMARKDLSVDAQNIKIIDNKGYVTLRGPVDTLQEKDVIEQLAEQCCGSNFRSELEVKR